MVARKRPSVVDEAPDFPEKPRLYTCGSPGVWTGSSEKGKYLGGIGCQRKVEMKAYDIFSRLCLACRNSMCAEFGVPHTSSGPCETAIRRLHAFISFLDGFGDVPRREAVRMLVLASQGEVNEPSNKEELGAAKIVSKFPAMMEYWPESSKRTLTEAIGKVPSQEKKEPARRLPPQLEGLLGAESFMEGVGG